MRGELRSISIEFMLRSAIPELDRRGLRSFGLTTGLMVAALFGLALPWLLEHQVPIWPWTDRGRPGRSGDDRAEDAASRLPDVDGVSAC